MAQRDVRLPRRFRTTHQTAGLAGFPAVDVFGQPGEPVLAPESGTLVDVHQIPWDQSKRVGGTTAYLQGADNNTYFLTHLGGNVQPGPVQAGQPIAQVGAVPGGWWQPHVHEGLHEGLYNPGDTGGAAPVTQALAGQSSDGGWQAQVLNQLGVPVTPQNILALNAWHQAEGGSASNNWLNTTQQAPGASSYNSVGVRNYVSPEQGVQATVETLQNGRYAPIIQALKAGTSAQAVGEAVAGSPWGTGRGVLNVLGGGYSDTSTSGPVAAPPAQAAPTRTTQSAKPRPLPQAVKAALQILRA